MKSIGIGIWVHAEPERLHASLASLRAHTSYSYECLLLPDGPDEATQAALALLNDYPQSATAEPRGAAACFNRLAALSKAEVLILLEGGSQTGPGWLDHLLAALAADPTHGLAGPSTNNAWNQQCVFPHASGTPAAIVQTSQAATQRFARMWRTLEPLYSLADFCYVVRREVVETIGAANEEYGLGPCWEMDYNIRAARAGWRGVWACAAYVHRAPFTARRRREEALRFAASKQRYQDAFCGARLRHEKSDYRSHCRGDACKNFAPVELIALHRPLPAPPVHVEPALFTPPEAQTGEAQRDAQASGSAHTTVQPNTVQTVCVTPPHEPLVSCIMPTYNRRSFVPQALRCFLRQDYAHRELIVVDDGSDPVADCIPNHPDIRYLRLDQKLTIGAKRNFACLQARGDVICHWDDDDWYPSWRIRTQVRTLVDRSADLCGSSRIFYYDAGNNRAWEYRYSAPGAAWVAGSTLAYRKDCWEQHKFTDVQVGEDSRFVWSAAKKVVADLADSTLCVAMLHAGNTSRKEPSGTFWHPRPNTEVATLLGDDRYFYRTGPTSPSPASTAPLVSCIMPTYNRRAFLLLALRHFRAQDYPHKELIIVDDGSDAVGDLIGDAPDVRYLRLTTRASIGAKRNLACQHARGEIIAHWDDDDWYAPDRLRYQIAPILMNTADMTGLENAWVLQLPQGIFWRTQPELHQRMFAGDVHGGTLVYRKGLLTPRVRYPDVNLAEDAWLLQQAVRNGTRLMRLANPGIFMYVRHGGNAWRECVPGQFLNPAGWQRVATPLSLPPGILEAYRRAREGILPQY